MKAWITLIFALTFSAPVLCQESFRSPNGKIEVSIATKEELQLSVSMDGIQLVNKIQPRLRLSGGKVFGESNNLKKIGRSNVNEEIRATVPTKSSVIKDQYVEKVFFFKDFKFEVRAYNNRVAYRFISKLRGEMFI